MPAAKTAPQPASDPPSVPISQFPFPLSERELSRLWRDQTFPPEALVSGSGERLRVIYRGRPGAGAGPDFRDALIAAPGCLLQGDVELHVRSSDFRRHGHDRDPAYAGVVLHLVFHDDQGGRTPLPGGGVAIVVALGDWARGRAAEIERWLERPVLWREPCFSAPDRLGVKEVALTLERLGEMRFRQKAAGLAREIGKRQAEKGARPEAEDERLTMEDARTEARGLLPSSSLLLPAAAEQVLWEAVLGALAHGGAREQFGLLAERLPWAELRRGLVALPPQERGREAFRLLVEAADTIAGFGRGSGRPAGRPEKRLAGAAQLAARLSERGLAPAFLDVLEGGAAPLEGVEPLPENTKSENRKAWATKSQSTKAASNTDGGSAVFRFSSSELRAGQNRRSEAVTLRSLIAALSVSGLIGRSRAVEVAGNAVLPWLAALGPEARTRQAEALYRRLPLPARYGAVRHLHEAVGRGWDSENRKRKTKGDWDAENGDRKTKGDWDAENGGRKTKGDWDAENGDGKTGNGSSDFPVSSFDRARDVAGVRVDFRRQQGMLYLLRQYCTQGGCGRCPLS